MEQFKHVGVTGRHGRSEVADTLRRLVTFLESRDVTIVLDSRITDMIPNHCHPTCVRDALGEHCDLVIVVGGDGSLLGAARALVDFGIPVIGVNHGRLGFLTDICPSELETLLSEVLDGQYLEENRFLLEVEVERNGQIIDEGCALNDVVLHPGRSTRIIEFELFIDGQFVYKQRSDGIIIATPTGSTAYALSGGGPIMHPALDAIVLVPMFPHMLTNRPLVISGNSEVRLVICEVDHIDPQISCDGQIHLLGHPNDSITIRKKARQLKSLHPEHHDFYDACRSKLRWNHQEHCR